MCGRFFSKLNAQEIKESVTKMIKSIDTSTDRKIVDFNLNSYTSCKNISPGMKVPVILNSKDPGSKLCINMMTWGLIPSFHRTEEPLDHFKMFNCRSETMKTKKSFSKLVNDQRCIVLVDGYFEWKNESDGKQPYYIRSKIEFPLKLAGLYDTYDNVQTFTILTANAIFPEIRGIHERQPVILSDSQAFLWLNGTDPEYILNDVFDKDNIDNIKLAVFPVDKKVNSVAYQGGIECITPLAIKKQKNLLSFYGSSSAVKRSTDVVSQSRECPICNKIFASDLYEDNSFNIHVNNCLDGISEEKFHMEDSNPNKKKKI